MAIDDNVDTNSLDNATKSANTLQSAMGLVAGSMTNVINRIVDFGKQATASTDDASEAMDDYTSSISNMIGAMSNISNKSFSGMIKGAEDATMGVDKLTRTLMNVGAVTIKTDTFDKFTVAGEASINAVNTHMDELASVMTKLKIPDSFIKGFKTFLDNAAASEKLTNSYIALSAATGTMNELFANNKLKDMSSLTAQFTDFVDKSAAATGQDTKAVYGYAAMLGTIPGFMKSIITSGQGSTTQIDGLTTAMKLMMGSGQGMETVTKELTTAFEDLANAHGKLTSEQSAQRGVEFFATMSNAANELGLRFQDVQTLMNNVAGTFKFTGDNTAAAATILGRYSGALQDTGLTSKAATELTGDMIKQVAGLTVAQKAYISSQSGGPGGLQGAFKIEQMIREGKTDQVMQMTERVMRQKMGGPIIGLKEAAESPQAAAQFMKQRMMLQQGVFGIGKGTPDDQATRILEALKTRDTKAFTELSGKKGLDTVVEKGNQIQQNNSNTFKSMMNSLNDIAVATALTAGIDVKELGGNKNVLAAAMNAQEADMATGNARDQAKVVGAKMEHDPHKEIAKQGAAGAAAFAVNTVIQAAAAKKAAEKGIDYLKSSTTHDRDMMGAHATARGAGTRVLERSMAAHQHPGAQQMAHPLMREHTIPAGHATMPHGAQNVNLSIKVIAPEGFDVVASSHSSNVKAQMLTHNQLVQAPSMVPRK
jgi:hypothetical protein